VAGIGAAHVGAYGHGRHQSRHRQQASAKITSSSGIMKGVANKIAISASMGGRNIETKNGVWREK